jgi:hypothetical protein
MILLADSALQMKERRPGPARRPSRAVSKEKKEKEKEKGVSLLHPNRFFSAPFPSFFSKSAIIFHARRTGNHFGSQMQSFEAQRSTGPSVSCTCVYLLPLLPLTISLSAFFLAVPFSLFFLPLVENFKNLAHL